MNAQLITWHVNADMDDFFWRCSLEVVGKYRRGDNYQVTPRTISPPDSECIDIHHVYLVYDTNPDHLYKKPEDGANPKVDILSILTESQVQELEERILDEINENR